jgi:phenylalanyl-tRNA synthetase beta chain
VKISLNWLRDFIDIDMAPDALEALLRRAGLEVAGVVTRGVSDGKVVVAGVLSSERHPNADRLSVCEVDDGSGHPRQIVCGAKNYQVGDKVPLALPGAVLPGGFKIKSGKLRGVASEGMMCSAKELGLAEDAEGLMILDGGLQSGTPMRDVFPADTVLELETTPNRPDWLSHLGVAREIAAFTGASLKAGLPEAPAMVDAAGRVVIEDGGCGFYTARGIDGVTVGPSPGWLVERLAAVGLRSVNNVVDVTNLVLFELGQPLHAFDADKISGAIRVRGAAEGETFRGLDGRDHTLPEGALVIADERGVLALAGVMGGAGSGVTASTTRVLLESAWFDPVRVRRSSRALGLHTDSSHRFERGVDPEGVAGASARAVELILELAGGTADGPLLAAGACPPRGEVALRHDRARALLGFDPGDDEIVQALRKVGLVERGVADGVSRWEIPGYRDELRREADLIEEVVRMVGIERVPSITRGIHAPASDADAAHDFAMGLRLELAGMGFHEARTGTLVSAAAATGESVALRNPFGDDQSRLRNSLLPGLLAATRRNLDRGAESVPLFEIGRVFHPAGEGARLAMIATGWRTAADWRGGERRMWDVFDLTGAANRLAAGRLTLVPRTDAGGTFAVAADVMLDGGVVGVVGQLPPAVGRGIDARGPVVAAEFDLDAWRRVVPVGDGVVAPLPKYPGSSRDIAFTAPQGLAFASVLEAIQDVKEPLLVSTRLFDLFTDPSGVKVPAGKKSLAISLTFRSAERTLTHQEVQDAADRIKAALKASLEVEFRE